jgi:hypothetical protein
MSHDELLTLIDQAVAEGLTELNLTDLGLVSSPSSFL